MQRRYFFRLLLTVASLAAVLVVLLSAILYSCFSRLTMENIHRADRNALSQISYGKEYMDMAAENLGRMLYTNNYIASAITGSAYDPIVSTQALNTMQMLILSNDGIDSIYYYITTKSSAAWPPAARESLRASRRSMTPASPAAWTAPADETASGRSRG